MYIDSTEKDKALEDLAGIRQELGRMSGKLDRLGVVLGRMSDALEVIATEAARPHEEQLKKKAENMEFFSPEATARRRAEFSDTFGGK